MGVLLSQLLTQGCAVHTSKCWLMLTAVCACECAPSWMCCELSSDPPFLLSDPSLNIPSPGSLPPPASNRAWARAATVRSYRDMVPIVFEVDGASWCSGKKAALATCPSYRLSQSPGPLSLSLPSCSATAYFLVHLPS